MYKLCITDYMEPPASFEEEELKGLAAVECLRAKTADALIGRVADADALLVFHEVTVPKAVIDTLTKCRVIARTGVGVDNVDVAAASAKGIVVTNVPDYGVDEVADHAMALMLSCNRGLLRADRMLKPGLKPWDYRAIHPTLRLAGATMGIVGLGRIGTATALRAKAFKMRVLACDPYIAPGIDKSVGVQMADLPTLLSESDVVSLHVPLTDETRGMIDAAAISRMKPNAILVNTARGAVVDVVALAEALREGKIGGAGIDVLPTEPPGPDEAIIRLWLEGAAPPVNLVITPHSAFYSEAGMVEMRVKAAQEVARVLRGQRPRYCVNAQQLARVPWMV